MLQHGSFKVFLHYYGDNGLLQGINDCFGVVMERSLIPPIYDNFYNN